MAFAKRKFNQQNQRVPTGGPHWENVRDTFEDMLHHNNPMSSTAAITSISTLSHGTTRPRVLGTLIRKGQLKQFISKKDGDQKFVMDITVRDTAHDFINVSCWGQKHFIDFIFNSFHVGDVVVLDGVVVQAKPLDETHEKFKPFTPSHYFLNLYESKGTISAYHGDDEDFYARLLHFPAGKQNDYYTMFDMIANGESLLEQDVSIMAAIKQVGSVKDMVGKSGKMFKRCEVQLFDDTSSDLCLVLWDEDWIWMAKNWVPKETIIYCADVKVSYDRFKKKVVVVATNRTIITPQPETREAFLLSKFAQTVDFSHLMSDENDLEFQLDNASLSCITEELTIEGIKAYMENCTEDLYCATWSFLSSFNIDDPSYVIISWKCCYCNKLLSRGVKSCGCAESAGRTDQTVPLFNLKVSLSDHTGTLERCAMPSPIVEKLMGESSENFVNLSEDMKTTLKWKSLLERFRATIQVSNSSTEKKIRVLSLESVQSEHMFRRYISFLKEARPASL